MAAKKKTSATTKDLKKLKANKCNSEACTKAYLILKHTHDSSQALLRAYRLARMVRALEKDQDGKNTSLSMKGMSTDEEQDLLRSMLVTAASGLDSMTKQLIRDTLPVLLESDTTALKSLEKYVQRKIKGEIEDDISDASSFLARILVSPSTQDRIINDYINYLTKGSLQSSEEISKIVSALGIPNNDVLIEHKKLKPIFDVRNKIIHELDINLDEPRRNRNIRTEAKMKDHTNVLIGLAQDLLLAVERKLPNAT